MAEPKMHIGKRYKIKFVGGDQHGEVKSLRAPMPTTHEVARASEYKGEGVYSPRFGYQTYLLRFYKDEPYYILQDWVDAWNLDPEEVLSREVESDNQRRIREEKELAEREKKLARADFETLGIAIEGPGGKRIDPTTVRIYINSGHPEADKWLKKRKAM